MIPSRPLSFVLLALVVAAPGQVRAVSDNQPKSKTKFIDVDPDPGTLQTYQDKIGKSFYFEVTGRAGAGTVWGTGVYTNDSSLAAAAVHAGVLREGQKAILKVTILPGQDAYPASTRNGVTSQAWAQWNCSFRVERADPRLKPRLRLGKAQPDPGNLSGYRDKVGRSFLFSVTGNVQGTVWGTGVYTDDSALATAAVHAGVLRNGQKGVVKVTILAGQPGYNGSTQNGVTSQPWGNWTGSFRVEAVKK